MERAVLHAYIIWQELSVRKASVTVPSMIGLSDWLSRYDFLLRSHTLRRLVWLGSSLLFLGLFLKVTLELREDDELVRLDQETLLLVSELRIDALNGSAVDVTALGSPTVITWFTLLGVVLLALNRDLRGCAYLTIGSIGSGLATWIMKSLFTRERPSVVPRLVEVSGFSYPSGHALAASAFYLLMMFLAWRHFRTLKARAVTALCALTMIAGVAFSRLYLGVHYPSDVLSGICLGAAWSCLLTAFFSRKA